MSFCTSWYPRLTLQIVEGDPPVLQDRHLRTRDIDLLIGRLPAESAAAGIDTEVLLHESAAVIAGIDSPWARRRKITLAELVDEPWCLPPPETFPGVWIAKAFRTQGLEMPRARVTAHPLQMLQVLGATGRFLGIVPDTMMHFSAKRLGFKALPVDLPDQRWPVGIVRLMERTPSPAAQLFCECARVVAKPLA